MVFIPPIAPIIAVLMAKKRREEEFDCEYCEDEGKFSNGYECYMCDARKKEPK